VDPELLAELRHDDRVLLRTVTHGLDRYCLLHSGHLMLLRRTA